MNIDGYCVLGTGREFDLDAEALVRVMDKSGVDRAVIAPVDRCQAVANREGNDFILSHARKYKDRFIPSCSVNPWYDRKAEDELHRSIAAGARLLVFNPFIQGFQACDELIYPLLELASEEKLPVYIHTGNPGNATPWQLVGLAERYPGLDIIMGHCGATDFWNDVIFAAQAADNIYLEASLARPFVFSGYVKSLKKGKGIMGSFAPVNELSFEWEQMRKVLPEEEWKDVYGGNLKRLLEKRGGL